LSCTPTRTIWAGKRTGLDGTPPFTAIIEPRSHPDLQLALSALEVGGHLDKDVEISDITSATVLGRIVDPAPTR